ncbi:MAG: hypothetical protein EB141_01540 [Verrucomicrobia bacterium]|nr:hypothetical protein [Verrucomicrobiota bacterium]NBU10283.1 hypothetical protein [Pseudomonadota bacterium]NDA66137.1 hypothetical protein [Verrucomicrobiota bacterium]NDB74327.1 hypothetical protein [Verrucomicrobiota bacterium]NDD37961.1 hypothetical protein [Verrucomicrobiota bacterium]
MKRSLPLLLVFVAARLACAQMPVVAFDSAKVVGGTALPGSNLVVAATFKIQPGYYLHSNHPTMPKAVATEAQVSGNYAAQVPPVGFGATVQKTIPGTPQPVPVYEGSLSIQVPVVIRPNARFPLVLPGIIGYAPVEAKTHTPGPIEKVRFEITVPMATNVPPTNVKGPGKK